MSRVPTAPSGSHGVPVAEHAFSKAADPGAEGHAHSLSALAYARVTEMIRRRALTGGQTIVEQRLADALGISRTPLREALQRLEGEGLVVKRSNRSFTVREVGLAEYLHSLKVREVLEPEAVALATPRLSAAAVATLTARLATLPAAHEQTDAHWDADDALHALFLDACGNPILGRMVHELRVTTRLFEIARLSERVTKDSEEHGAILRAAGDGDVRAARRAMAAHIRSLSSHAMATVR